MLPESQSEGKSAATGWAENLARLHPTAFDAGLVLLAGAVTIVLLMKTGYTLILYQGF